VSDLLKATADSPLLLAFLVILGGLVWAIEKLADADGPITRLFRAWQEREVRRLRRQQLVDRERRAARDARVEELESEVAWLRGQLDDARQSLPPRAPVRPLPRPRAHEPATTPIPRSRNSARGAVADR
jgi:hypothetical protein